MENIISIFVRSIFIDNMVFAFFFGMCSYIAVSKSVKTAMGLGIAVIFVMVMTVPINYLLNEFILSPGALGWIIRLTGRAGGAGSTLAFSVFSVFSALSPRSCSWSKWWSRNSRRHCTISWEFSCR